MSRVLCASLSQQASKVNTDLTPMFSHKSVPTHQPQRKVPVREDNVSAVYSCAITLLCITCWSKSERVNSEMFKMHLIPMQPLLSVDENFANEVSCLVEMKLCVSAYSCCCCSVLHMFGKIDFKVTQASGSKA